METAFRETCPEETKGMIVGDDTRILPEEKDKYPDGEIEMHESVECG